jgi:hypothetical protein
MLTHVQYGGWHRTNVGSCKAFKYSRSAISFCVLFGCHWHHLALNARAGAAKSHRATGVDRGHRSQNRHEAQCFCCCNAQKVRFDCNSRHMRLCFFRHCADCEALSHKAPRKYASMDALLQVKRTFLLSAHAHRLVLATAVADIPHWQPFSLGCHAFGIQVCSAPPFAHFHQARPLQRNP